MAHRYSVRHWFVPTKHNQFHPHLLRSHSLAVVAGFMVLVQVLFNASLTGQPNVLGFATDINVGTIVNLTNQERSKGGLGNLTTNAELMQAAQAKADADAKVIADKAAADAAANQVLLDAAAAQAAAPAPGTTPAA